MPVPKTIDQIYAEIALIFGSNVTPENLKRLMEDIANYISGVDPTINNIINDVANIYNVLSLPIKLIDISANTTVVLKPDTLLDYIYMEDVDGAPLLKIGSEPGAADIFEEQLISGFSQSHIGEKNKTEKILYITLSGGKLNICFDLKSNIFTQ